ncbi:MAG: hypothetical protein GY834_11040 [Bacteroidetes bacterium]|nr:hypothetical protein [Bacteroidota bacterium]
MNNSGIQICVAAKKYVSNPIYTYRAPKDFEKNTTTTSVKKTLVVQAFFDKVFSVDWISNFLATRLKNEKRVTIMQPSEVTTSNLKLGNCEIQSQTTLNQTQSSSYILKSEFEVLQGKLKNASYNLGLEFEEWDKENFICAPGASYNGGRFHRIKAIYPPFHPPELWKKDIPLITSIMPGLDIDKPNSQMDLLLSEITSPMVGIWLKKKNKGIWIKTTQQGIVGNNGFSIREDLNTKKLILDLMTPVVRENIRCHGASAMPSWDIGQNLKKGDKTGLEMTIYTFDCRSIKDFYGYFRNILIQENPKPMLSENQLPLSESWKLIETLHNKKKWSETYSYYHAGFIPPFIEADSWSAGFTGGLALSYALLNQGNELSQKRALRNLDFFFSEGGQSDAGIFYATSDGENWGGDNYWVTEGIGTSDWLHIRRSGDQLYFVIKHFKLLEARNQKSTIQKSWLEKTKKCADALCKIWENNKQFGHYINPNTLEIRVGNSDAGDIIPAALAECAAYFDNKRYLETAEESLTFYYYDFMSKGFTVGCAPDAVCAPDCESAVNLLESLVAVFEITQNKDWLKKAHHYSDYVRTWFYTYDVKLPPESFYGRLGIQTTGACYANSQNRCGVPNICTLSGDVFWKLYRYTKDEHVLHLIQECVHNTQQYVSRKDRPITTIKGKILSEAVIHECIQTGDWAGPTGEIPYEYPTSWAEVAQLLSICEIPGIYLVSDQARLFVVDHLDVEITSNDENELTLQITNRTKFDSKTRLYVECENQMSDIPKFAISQDASIELQIPAGGTISHTVSI